MESFRACHPGFEGFLLSEGLEPGQILFLILIE